MCVIYVVEEHDQVLELWRDQQAISLNVIHLDAHCDMRGLLIDRQVQRAYPIWDKSGQVDQGNYLAHAILEGRVNNLLWVYSESGGRQYDVGTVKYESDLTALFFRWYLKLRGNPGIPIHYADLPAAIWDGEMEGEYLDIDWDFFASKTCPIEVIQERVQAFLAKDFKLVPAQVYVCYSPEFSHPSRNQFQQFIEKLARLFNARIVSLRPENAGVVMRQPFYRKYLPVPFFRIARSVYYTANLFMRKWGIY